MSESHSSQTVGKTLAFTSILFKNHKDEVFARGSHTKYISLAWKDPNNITEELSPKPTKGKEGSSPPEEKNVDGGKKKEEGKEKPGPQDEKVPEGFDKLPNVPS